ncbi:bifunctional phosphoribosyl-AMP cyclohydrolase/phosphoribosyl-ATP diphosphatase HisIE [Thermohalobacter berrensis]|uniref:Histidine biosynthesis bifunctional protein HisIE n=1 Tax=Thermohalobacter berrensis TaxID=99594 RepID=A0A419T679_9FIRM|nr:bifunctional phosphoribosyl-AMP cyclohydrolase/phosphoribosyl-ATP diphosphatase HisIE [Thermohalobacter berrensis]RKD32929.1 bifunctional phosphoribosyl-AMP cyclohydrolase/phosphoribosyl-ATP pyrophosphatase [Thermohalobacter berrensis]
MKFIEKIKFDSNGLVPAVIQDIETNKVLMVAYMNKESLKRTIETGKTWFYSRSRKKLWNKGETSGNFQEVLKIYYDCDKDTLLIKVKQKGVACHTGKYSCFHNEVLSKDYKNYDKVISELYEVIKGRRNNPVKGSYTSYLFEKGIDKILKKVGEESSEVIIAAKNNDKKELIYEISDLVYHLLVLMVNEGIDIDSIKKELYDRSK